jgi:hypothetical protein
VSITRSRVRSDKSAREKRRQHQLGGLYVEANRYSVGAGAVGRPVKVRAYANRIELRQDGRIVGEHARSFSRGKTIYDPWNYVLVLARKPGALRNGAPFKDWVLPASR